VKFKKAQFLVVGCLEEDLNLRPKELVMKKAKLQRIGKNSLSS
jgi:hypothetical protein